MAKEVHLSLKYTRKIIRKAAGDSDSQEDETKEKRSLSSYLSSL